MTSFVRTSLVAVLATLAGSSQAHISYSGRTFGTVVNGSQLSITTQSVTSNYGWADASDTALVFNAALASTPRVDEASFVSGTGTDDLYLGDSHKGKAFKLHLDNPLTVTFSAAARNASGLTPAFSVYQGLVSPAGGLQTSADHDFAAASQAWRTTYAQGVAGPSASYLATQGSWNALGDWAIGGDGDPAGVSSALDYLHYVGSAASTVANGTATASFTLGAGDYTVFVGGNHLAGKSQADSTKAYALALSVSAVPEPQAALLLLLGLPLLAWRRRRAA